MQHIFFLSDTSEVTARSQILSGLFRTWVWAAIWIAASLWMVYVEEARLEAGPLGWSTEQVVAFTPDDELPAYLANQLAASDPRIRWRAAEALSKRIDEDFSATLRLMSVLDDPNDAVRRQAIEPLTAQSRSWLAEPPGPEALDAFPLLVRHLEENPWGEARVYAAMTLWRLSPPAEQAVPVLLGALQDHEAGVRMHALIGSQHVLGPAETVVPAATALLQDEDSEVRTSAVYTLAKYGPGAHAGGRRLIQLLKEDDDEKVRQAIFRAIERVPVPAETALPLFRDLLASESSDDRVRGAYALANPGLDASDILPDLMEALEDEDGRVRASAASALGELGPKAAPALPPMVEALLDPEGKTIVAYLFSSCEHWEKWARRRLPPCSRSSRF